MSREVHLSYQFQQIQVSNTKKLTFAPLIQQLCSFWDTFTLIVLFWISFEQYFTHTSTQLCTHVCKDIAAAVIQLINQSVKSFISNWFLLWLQKSCLNRHSFPILNSLFYFLELIHLCYWFWRLKYIMIWILVKKLI